jgi:pimeloyl-ACP methyl ester carboxylesterase
MNHNIWDAFGNTLSKSYKVFTPDLPGFGQSPLHPSLTIDTVADSVIQWIRQQNISSSILIGHSLGGYVSLAMVEKAPQLFSGFGLFHSTALADSSEKKESRTKTIEFIRKNGVEAFTSNFIQPLFADPKHPAIPDVRNITIQSTEGAVIAYTLAMRERPDRQDVLQNSKRPILFLGGEKDPGIPVDSLKKQAETCRFPTLHILESTGHMGMFEQPEKASEIIRTFITRCEDSLKSGDS